MCPVKYALYFQPVFFHLHNFGRCQLSEVVASYMEKISVLIAPWSSGDHLSLQGEMYYYNEIIIIIAVIIIITCININNITLTFIPITFLVNILLKLL